MLGYGAFLPWRPVLSPCSDESQISAQVGPNSVLTSIPKYCLPSPFTDGNQISYADLKALLEKSQNLFIVDVRTKEEIDKGRIPGSLHVPGEMTYM